MWLRAIYQISSGVIHGLSGGLSQASYRLDMTDSVAPVKRVDVDQRMPEGAGGVVIACFIATMKRIREVLGWGHITLDLFGSAAMQFLNSGPNVVS